MGRIEKKEGQRELMFKCPVSLSCIEVSNIFWNRLTDVSGRILPTVIKECKGKKNPISGNAMANLLKSFSDLDITDVALNKMSIESLCHLLQSSSSISALATGGTYIGVNGAFKLSRSLAMRTTAVNMLDMSFCWVDPHGGLKLCQDFILHGLVQLDMSENRLEEKGANALGHLLAKACCHLKILMINKCHLGKMAAFYKVLVLLGTILRRTIVS